MADRILFVPHRPRWRVLAWRIGDAARDLASRLFLLRLAHWLDARHPRWCWAKLCVGLGLAYDLVDWRGESGAQGAKCRVDAADRGTCWCGKMRCADAMERAGFPAADVAEQRAAERDALRAQVATLREADHA